MNMTIHYITAVYTIYYVVVHFSIQQFLPGTWFDSFESSPRMRDRGLWTNLSGPAANIGSSRGFWKFQRNYESPLFGKRFGVCTPCKLIRTSLWNIEVRLTRIGRWTVAISTYFLHGNNIIYIIQKSFFSCRMNKKKLIIIIINTEW